MNEGMKVTSYLKSKGQPFGFTRLCIDEYINIEPTCCVRGRDASAGQP